MFLCCYLLQIQDPSLVPYFCDLRKLSPFSGGCWSREGEQTHANCTYLAAYEHLRMGCCMLIIIILSGESLITLEATFQDAH